MTRRWLVPMGRAARVTYAIPATTPTQRQAARLANFNAPTGENVRAKMLRIFERPSRTAPIGEKPPVQFTAPGDWLMPEVEG